MQYLYENSQTIDRVIPDDETKYNVKNYPYVNMLQNPRSTEIEIRSNGEDSNGNNNNDDDAANMMASSNNNKTIITDETPNLGETGDILSDLQLTP